LKQPPLDEVGQMMERIHRDIVDGKIGKTYKEIREAVRIGLDKLDEQPPAAPTDIDGAIAEIDDALNFISLNPHGKLAMLRVRDKLTTESTPFIDDLRETINNTAHREMTRAEEVEYEQAIANAELSEGCVLGPVGVTLYCPGCNQAIKSNHQCKEERDEE
jgi:hypothetical protein